MSRIEKLPKEITEAIKPYLTNNEVVLQALLHDDQKASAGLEIWLIKTNQAIILHGQQVDPKKPGVNTSILVYPLDELKEIDFLVKLANIQLVFNPSTEKTEAARLRFSKNDNEVLGGFFQDLGDIITYRVTQENGKIMVHQRALPIGDKDRKIFGRGIGGAATSGIAVSSAPAKTETKPVSKVEAKPATNISKPVQKVEQKPVVKEEVKPAVVVSAVKTESKIETAPLARVEQKPAAAPAENVVMKTPSVQVAKTEPKTISKAEETTQIPKAETIIPNNKAAESKLSAKPASTVKTDVKPVPQPVVKAETEEPEQAEKPAKEIDYGSPVFIAAATIIATFVGFMCLYLFKTLSRFVSFWRRH